MPLSDASVQDSAALADDGTDSFTLHFQADEDNSAIFNLSSISSETLPTPCDPLPSPFDSVPDGHLPEETSALESPRLIHPPSHEEETESDEELSPPQEEESTNFHLEYNVEEDPTLTVQIDAPDTYSNEPDTCDAEEECSGEETESQSESEEIPAEIEQVNEAVTDEPLLLEELAEATQEFGTSEVLMELEGSDCEDAGQHDDMEEELKEPEFAHELFKPIAIVTQNALQLESPRTPVIQLSDSPVTPNSSPTKQQMVKPLTITPISAISRIRNNRRRKTENFFLQSPSPFLRGAGPQRIAPTPEHKKILKKIPMASVDPLERYRRDSILQKATIAEMVDDLFSADEVLEDSDLEEEFRLTPDSSPVKLTDGNDEISTPLHNHRMMSTKTACSEVVPGELFDMLEAQKKEKSAQQSKIKVKPEPIKGSIVVMTPIKTNKKDKSLLDSDQKLTNVRRSARKHQKEICPLTAQSREQLLEYCNYSYKPNDTLHVSNHSPVMLLSDTLKTLSISKAAKIEADAKSSAAEQKEENKTSKPQKENKEETKEKQKNKTKEAPRQSVVTRRKKSKGDGILGSVTDETTETPVRRSARFRQ